MVILLFTIFYFIILFNFAGYIFVLKYLKNKNPAQEIFQKVSFDELPIVYILVPTFNEQDLIEIKIKNLHSLDYPEEKKKIIFIDGGSSDNTQEILKKYNAHTMVVHGQGKIAQLNQALKIVPENAFVLVTDADAEITNFQSLQLAYQFFKNSNVGVVGGWARPPEPSSLGIEVAFWDKQNRLRFMESQAFSSSIVTALFYFFPKSLIEKFPADCLADDVYIAFQAHLQRKKVIYASEIDVLELRQAKNYYALFKQKLRKANAYSIELLRVGHALPRMHGAVKFLYLYKIFQFFYLPWVCLFFISFTVFLMLVGHYVFILVYFLIAVALVGLASYLIAPPANRVRGGLRMHSAFLTILSFSFCEYNSYFK